MAILKRLVAPSWWPIQRKTSKFVVSVRGPHPKNLSIPLLVFVRDIIKIAETNKEARTVIKKGEVLVDGRKIKDIKYGIGLLDAIEIPVLKKAWRAIPKNGLSFIEISEKEAKLKICKIINKRTIKGNKLQMNLHDGRNILTNEKYSTYDSILVELPKQKIINHIKFEEGSLALVCEGKNAGKIAKIKKIEGGRIWLGDEKVFEVPKNLTIVVGKNEPLIKLE